MSILVQESSGSVRHKVLSVSKPTALRPFFPEGCPRHRHQDMAQWHILVELSKHDLAQTDIKVEIV